MKIVSLFSGAGGLDLGFKRAGFNIVWANEYDKTIWETYEKNHPETILEKRSIKDINIETDIPDCDVVIGGPPCQSWSEAGSRKGINDDRGKLFFSFIDVIKAKKPKFFLAENVPGILLERNKKALDLILNDMSNNGLYEVFFQELNAKNLGSCQDRKRVVFIGVRKDILEERKNKIFKEKDIISLFPIKKRMAVKTIKEVISDLEDKAKPFDKNNRKKDNNEYLVMDFSPMFMSRNRIRGWEEQSFTIQASGRHSPLHPSSGKMNKISKDLFVFEDPEKVRRFSVRESARIQGFPDDFIFYYNNVLDGYKMTGNAVSVDMAYEIAKQLKKCFIDE